MKTNFGQAPVACGTLLACTILFYIIYIIPGRS